MKIIKNEVIRGQMEAQHNVIDEIKEKQLVWSYEKYERGNTIKDDVQMEFLRKKEEADKRRSGYVEY